MQDSSKNETKSKLLRGLLIFAVGAALWFLPPPEGLTPAAAHLLAVFVATILGLILQPLPQGAVVLLGISWTALSGTLTLGDTLAGFSDGTVWLIVVAFLFARGFIQTGLGRRIAYSAVSLLGGSTLGLGYAVAVADLTIAPATPSNTARAGGILFPIVRSLCSSLGSEPGPTANRAGAYLMFTELQVNLVTAALFLTAVAPNAMMVKFADEIFGQEITWLDWFSAAVVPGLVSLVVLPLLIYQLFRPEMTSSHHARDLAREELEKMGSLNSGEKRMLGVFLVTLLFWATSHWSGMSSTAIALGALGALILGQVLSWDDVLSEKNAWDALIWFGGLVSLASGLGKLGVIDYFADSLGSRLSGFDSWLPAFVLLVLAYVYSHYFIASMTAHATAFYVPFGLVAVGLGAPALLVVLVLGFMNSLNAGTTHYGTGPSPIYFGAGYIDQATWWKNGLIVSLVNLAIWLLLGGLWWKIIGLW